jgi:hypothetical protein
MNMGVILAVVEKLRGKKLPLEPEPKPEPKKNKPKKANKPPSIVGPDNFKMGG